MIAPTDGEGMPAVGNIPDNERLDPTRGELLRRYRLQAGLTQEQLAERSGYSADYIRKLERGRRPAPPAALDRLATVLGLGDTDRLALRGTPDRVVIGPGVGRPLIGRGEELAAMRRLLTGAGPPVLLLAGEPGIGKTRLLEEVVTPAEQSGWRVVRGGSHRRAQDPYAPLTDALAASIAVLPDAERESALRRAKRLGLLLPEHRAAPGEDGETPAEWTLRPEQERRLLFQAVAEYLGAVAGAQGVLLVLDDLQWAGPDALDLLTTLITGGQPHGPPIRVIGAYRDSALPGGRLDGVVADLARAGMVRVLDLDPLAADEAIQLVTGLLVEGDGVHQALAPAIVRRAGGVPLFLVSFAEELERHGELELPWTVGQVIRQRVVALPEHVQQVLGVASVAGRMVTSALVGSVTGRSADDVLVALEMAASARLVSEADGDAYRFAHDVIREVIEGGLSAGRRRLLHRQIGEALEQLPGRVREGRAAELAWHFGQGDAPERALHWTLRAGDRAAALFAHGDASLQYRHAAALAQELGDAPAQAEALDKLADVLYGIARFDEALEALDAAAAVYRHLAEQDRYLRTMARIGEVCSFAGKADEGIARLLPVVQAVEVNGVDAPAELASVYAALGALYYHRGRWAESVTAAEAAAPVAQATGNLPALTSAEIWRGLSLGMLHRVAEQRDAFALAAEAAESLGDPWLRALATYHDAIGALTAGDMAEGERRMRRALDILEDADLIGWTAFVRSRLSDMLMARGRWAEAREEVERAEADSRALGPQPVVSYPLATLGRLQLLAGEEDEGRRRVREALEMAQQFDYTLGISLAQEILAWDAVRAGRPEEALARLDGTPEAERMVGRPPAPVIKIWARLDLCDVEGAAEALREDRAQAPAFDLPGLLRQSARMSAFQARWREAERDLTEGLAMAREIGLPYEEALLLEEAGRLQAAHGERNQVKAHLHEARAIFQRLGAAPDAARINETP